MSRKDDENRRAFYRWEFLRRNKEYQNDYYSLVENKADLIDLKIVSGGKKKDFIKKFFAYPVNPNFSYDEIVSEYKKASRTKQAFTKKMYSIYKKYLGKNWREINRRLFRYELRREVKFGFKKYISARNKAKEEVKRFRLAQNIELIEKKYGYLRETLHHLSAIKLSPEEADLYSRHTTVINSFLADSPNIEVFGSEYGFKYLSLVDSNVTDLDSNPMIDNFRGDLTRVCFTVDLSYPTNDIVADIKKEISKWKAVRRKYNMQKEKRQSLYFEDVKKILQTYDLREKGLTYPAIAKSSSPDAIQKTRNMYKKAKRYIDGGFKQIR